MRKILNHNKYIYLFLIFLFELFFVSNFADAKIFDSNTEITAKNKFFSLTLPVDTKGLYTVKKRDNGIFIYDKISKKAGFGGFVFGIKAFKNPSEHAVMPGSRKIGELTDKKNNLYDIVLIQPTDVQYDYVTGISDSYKKLYVLANITDKNIKGVNGSLYKNGQGMYGKDLYGEVLKKHLTAVNEKWDSIKLEKENMSYMYNVIAHTNKDVLDKIGYIYYDVNADGIEELFIGEIAGGNWKGVIYDIYTMVDRKPAHVISGGSRDRYFVCNDVFICNEYSSGALESGNLIYILVENSTELYPQVGFKYDEYENKKNPFFISYNFPKNEWENVSEQIFEERIKIFKDYQRFNYTPFSKLK